MTLDNYIAKVDTQILALTQNLVELADLTDFADGELSLSDMHDSKVPPKTAAKRILRANGADWL